MSREFRIPHSQRDTPQTYTKKVERYFEQEGLDVHRHEVESLEDDFNKGQRVLKVKTTKFFIMGGS